MKINRVSNNPSTSFSSHINDKKVLIGAKNLKELMLMRSKQRSMSKNNHVQKALNISVKDNFTKKATETTNKDIVYFPNKIERINRALDIKKATTVDLIEDINNNYEVAERIADSRFVTTVVDFMSKFFL